MIQVHHLNNSRSHRILWWLEEAGQPYEVVKYERDPQTMLAPPSLKKIHPLGKSPTIRDGDLILTESAAILEYLSQTYGNGRMTSAMGTPDWVQERFWLHFAEGSLMSSLLVWFNLMRVGDAAKPVIDRVRGQIDVQLQHVEDRIRVSQHLAGSAFTLADIQMSYPLELGAARGIITPTTFPSLLPYLRLIQSRPAYQAAVKRGGGYQYLLPASS